MSSLSISRRTLLRAGVGAGLGVTLAGTGRSLTRGAFADLAASQVRPLPDPNTSGLDHIVFLMMENRSYDHFLHWLPGGDGIRDQIFIDPESGEAKATENWGAGGRGDFHGCADGDPHHNWKASREQYLHGFAAGNNPDYAFGYYEPEDIPAIAGLAAGFTAYDRYFCSVLGGTFPNRDYLVSGTSGGSKINCLGPGVQCDGTGNEAGDTFDPVGEAGLGWPTVFDRLTEAGVSWRLYVHDLSTVFRFGERILGSGNIFTFEQYLADCASGQLPQVAMVEPRFDNAYTGIGNDDHWPHDVRLGQKLISDSFTALAESSHWPNSAFILTYDEHGGFYDHLQKPPRTRDDRANRANLDEDHGQLGFRVPTIVASPFARRGFVGHAQYDHTSILKLIEWRFRLAPMTRRDAAARNLGETFQWDAPDTSIPDGIERYSTGVVTGPFCPGGQPVFPDSLEVPIDIPPIPPVPTTAQITASRADHVTLTPEQARGAGHRAYAPAIDGTDHDLSAVFEAGIFERMGWRLPFETAMGEVPSRIKREVVR